MYARGCALAVILAGCGSFGTSGDDTPATPADGGGVPSEAAAADGSTAVDGGALPCPSNALFCDAFDARAAVQGAWDTQTAARGGMLALDASLFRGAPSSLRATTVPTGGTEADAHLSKTLRNVASSIHAAFAVRFASLEGVSYARIFAGTADGRDFEIAVGATNFQVHTADTKGALNYDPVEVVPVAGVWHQIDYVLVFAASGSVTISLDGATLYAKPLSLGNGTPIKELNLRFGVTSKQAIDVRYDDFSIAPN
jgi:hypothetical protein